MYCYGNKYYLDVFTHLAVLSRRPQRSTCALYRQKGEHRWPGHVSPFVGAQRATLFIFTLLV